MAHLNDSFEWEMINSVNLFPRTYDIKAVLSALTCISMFKATIGIYEGELTPNAPKSVNWYCKSERPGITTVIQPNEIRIPVWNV